MSEPARNRFALDLEDLERQLRNAGQAPKVGQPVDPLAELTRIVDQGDPLKDIFGHRGQAAAPQRVAAPWQAQEQPIAQAQPQFQGQPRGQVQPRQEPVFNPVQELQAAVEQSSPPAELRGALDEFEALLRRTDGGRPAPSQAAPAPAAAPARTEPRFVIEEESFELPEPQSYQRPVAGQGMAAAPRDLDEAREPYPYYDQQHYDAHPQHAELPADDEMPVLEPRRSRKGLYAAAALVLVGVVGGGVVMSQRGALRGSDGQPPTITADAGPTKVEPANPGGAEIPNQNKQIYERPGDTSAGPTKVVSREEQPVDVQQAARSMPSRVVLPGPGTGTATTPAANALSQAPAVIARDPAPLEPALTPVPPVPGLGEPRRVRTVSIRPDGTPAPAANGAAGYTNGTLSAGTDPAQPTRPGLLASTDPASTTASAQPRPRPATTPAQEAAKVQEPAKVQERAAATTPSAPMRVASVPPAAQAPAAPAPATAAIRSGTGDFVVQLGAPGSESEARATFAALQRKYPGQLGGQAPIVRKTELAGGKTVYRLRVGPYSREDATTMCTQLQAAGGQCFIAKN
ncbi:MAG TPA: SPOR domain-containing protein [Bosea sp. (in: a-proteobacteria)]|uniref:SPOR domain-containing protein n=1 Tax=Bosea sp. (in: a-proteobacteria) TaxID=1871050 RepID=UPI002E15E35A|nr:SPOR domain-containing protein [Bosea sp. (in: a-proteobacteria)]